jgi:iron complex outermembrane receptor protein
VPLYGYPRQFVNAPGPARTTGGEVFAVYEVAPVVITAFYSYLWASEVDPLTGLRREAPRNPRHNAFVDLAYETRGTWIALEVNWLSRQALTDDPYLTRAASFANVELLASRTFGHLTLYANADNLFNVRQTDYEPLLRPTRSAGQSWTVGQWAPVEGRLISTGLRYRF